jgi:hypothetical protein
MNKVYIIESTMGIESTSRSLLRSVTLAEEHLVEWYRIGEEDEHANPKIVYEDNMKTYSFKAVDAADILKRDGHVTVRNMSLDDEESVSVTMHELS